MDVMIIDDVVGRGLNEELIHFDSQVHFGDSDRSLKDDWVRLQSVRLIGR